jgi:hypothetical protein
MGLAAHLFHTAADKVDICQVLEWVVDGWQAEGRAGSVYLIQLQCGMKVTRVLKRPLPLHARLVKHIATCAGNRTTGLVGRQAWLASIASQEQESRGN